MANDKIYLQDILPLEQLKKDGKILLIRHYHEKLEEMVRSNLIEEYQRFQSKPAFKDCKYIVSFLGGEKNTGVFYGIYENKGVTNSSKLLKYTKGLKPYTRPLNKDTDFYLNLERKTEYDKYINRLIIDWIVPRGWYNTYGKTKDKPVIKIQPYNFVSDFPGLSNIKVSFIELKKIINNPESHAKWYNSLTRLQAVYLILDTSTGNQYIGITYGKEGLWQRWSSYVKGDGTCGNKQLKELKVKNNNFQNNLQFSILEVLAKTANQKYCTQKEAMWKEKLGTRAYGLNDN